MMPSRKLTPILTVGCAILLVAGCRESAEVLGPNDSGLASAHSQAAAASVSLPAGSYVSVITPGDFPPGFPQEVIDLLAGEWVLDLSDPRSYVVSLNGIPLIEGVSVANPARFVMRDVGGPLSCHLEHPRQANAVYAWSFSGNALTLSVIKDHCAERAFILTFKAWEKQ